MNSLVVKKTHSNVSYHNNYNKRKSHIIYSMKQKTESDRHIIAYYKTQQQIFSKELSTKIPKTIELCTDKSKLQECLIMWDEIEELSATLSDIKRKIKDYEE